MLITSFLLDAIEELFKKQRKVLSKEGRLEVDFVQFDGPGFPEDIQFECILNHNRKVLTIGFSR